MIRDRMIVEIQELKRSGNSFPEAYSELRRRHAKVPCKKTVRKHCNRDRTFLPALTASTPNTIARWVLSLCKTSHSGKTLLACAISNHVKQMGYTTVITSAFRLIDELTKVRGHVRSELIDKIRKHDLAVIDDLGMERSTAFTKELELASFDTRVRSGKPMAVTTNLSLKDMRECKDVEAARIYGRILENYRPMTLPTRDLHAESAAVTQLQAKELLR